MRATDAAYDIRAVRKYPPHGVKQHFYTRLNK